MTPIQYIIHLAEKQQYLEIEVFCKKLVEIHAGLKDCVLIDYQECAGELLELAVEKGLDEAEWVSRVYLSGVKHATAERALARAAQLGKWRQVTALIQLGVGLEQSCDEYKNLQKQQQFALNTHIEWQSIIKAAQTGPTLLQQVTGSYETDTITLLIAKLSQCAKWDSVVLGESINAITHRQVINPFTFPQWQMLCTALQRLSAIDTKFIHTQPFAEYQHPKQTASSITYIGLTNEQALQVKKIADSLIATLLRNSNIDDDEFDAAELAHYFRADTSKWTNEDRIKFNKLKYLLTDKECAFDFYRNKPAELLANQPCSPETLAAAEAFFRAYCADKIAPQQNLEAPISQTTLTQLPGFSDTQLPVLHQQIDNGQLDSSSKSGVSSAAKNLTKQTAWVRFADSQLSSQASTDVRLTAILPKQLEQLRSNCNYFLRVACQTNDLTTVQLLLSIPEISVSTKNGYISALDFAAQNGNYAILKLLLAHPTYEPRLGVEALGVAATHGKTACIKLLLAHGVTDNNGTALENAARKNRPDVMIELLQARPSVTDVNCTVEYVSGHSYENHGDSGGWYPQHSTETILMWALIKVHPQVVAALLNHPNIDVNAKKHEPPIMFAIRKNEPDLFTRLMRFENLDLKATNGKGKAPLAVAVKYRRIDMLKVLLKDPRTDVNQLSPRKKTALMVAARKGDAEMVAMLLAKNCNVNIQNDLGYTALGIAVKYGHEKIVDMLLAVPGIKINTVDRHAISLLAFAIEKQEKMAKQFLARLDVNINQPAQKDRWMPLSSALYHKSETCVLEILKRADLDMSAHNQAQEVFHVLDHCMPQSRFTNKMRNLLNGYMLQKSISSMPNLTVQLFDESFIQKAINATPVDFIKAPGCETHHLLTIQKLLHVRQQILQRGLFITEASLITDLASVAEQKPLLIQEFVRAITQSKVSNPFTNKQWNHFTSLLAKVPKLASLTTEVSQYCHPETQVVRFASVVTTYQTSAATNSTAPVQAGLQRDEMSLIEQAVNVDFANAFDEPLSLEEYQNLMQFCVVATTPEEYLTQQRLFNTINSFCKDHGSHIHDYLAQPAILVPNGNAKLIETHLRQYIVVKLAELKPVLNAESPAVIQHAESVDDDEPLVIPAALNSNDDRSLVVPPAEIQAVDVALELPSVPTDNPSQAQLLSDSWLLRHSPPPANSAPTVSNQKSLLTA